MTTSKQLDRNIFHCEKNRQSPSCESFPGFKERFDSSVEAREHCEESSKFWLKVSYIVPLLVIFLFYSLRWVITGRLRPINVLTKKT
jgi:hypothetical protein